MNSNVAQPMEVKPPCSTIVLKGRFVSDGGRWCAREGWGLKACGNWNAVLWGVRGGVLGRREG